MKILAVDTSALVATAALCEDTSPIAITTQKSGLTHSETMLPMIRDLLKNAKTELDEIDLFAVSNGPGSFTGVRIGVSVIKGLAFGKGKPCVGVSTLAAMAQSIAAFCEGEIICPVMDARRNQLYAACFAFCDGVLHRLTADELIPADELIARLEAYKKPLRVLGDGYEILERARLPFMRETPKLSRLQNGYGVALEAYAVYTQAKDQSIFTDALLRPEYLRSSQAERELAKKQNA